MAASFNEKANGQENLNGETNIPHIQVIGSLNIDLVTVTPRVPGGGETITATSFSTHAGGKGANQAIACARASRDRPAEGQEASHALTKNQNVRVSMVGAVGNDAHADLLQTTLQRNGVEHGNVQRLDSTTTGVACILVEEASGQNRILFTPGANYKMEPGLVPGTAELAKQGKQPSLVVMQLEIPLKTVLAEMARAKKEGIPVLLNPAPAVKLPDEALQGLDYLVLNETEAGILCDLQTPESDEKMIPFLKVAFKQLLAKGVKNVVITLGHNGVAYSLPGNKRLEVIKKLPASHVDKVVDTTAAGDTFIGYYAVGIVHAKWEHSEEEIDPTEIIAQANRAAAKTVAKAGAMESIPFSDEVDGDVQQNSTAEEAEEVRLE